MTAPDPSAGASVPGQREPLRLGEVVWAECRVVEEDGGLYFQPISRAEWSRDDPFVITDLNATIARLNDEHRWFDQWLTVATPEQIEGLRSVYEHRKGEIVAIREAIVAACDETIGKQKHELRRLQGELDAAGKTIERLTEERNAARDVNWAFERNLTHWQKEAEKLNKMLNSAEDELAALRGKARVTGEAVRAACDAYLRASDLGTGNMRAALEAALPHMRGDEAGQ